MSSNVNHMEIRVPFAFSHGGAPGDNSSAYDPLNRLQAFRRGNLSASGNNGSGGLDTVSTLNTLADSSNSWNYDSLGNQTSTQGGNQTRTFNAQNQIASISGLTTPTYDNNGNMTTDQAGVTYKFDAWNRMVYASSNPTQSFRYDALNREIEYWTSGSDSFYSANWQLLEDDVSSTSKLTYVWGQRDPDDLVARDAGNLGAVTRTYVQQDANYNVTALIGSSGGVLERFTYDPYGSITVLTSAWATTTDSQNWVYYFQGGRYNSNIGLYYFQNRFYNPTTATWMQQDPTGTQYVDGANLYQFADSNPAVRTDPLGLAAKPGLITIGYDKQPTYESLGAWTYSVAFGWDPLATITFGWAPLVTPNYVVEMGTGDVQFYDLHDKLKWEVQDTFADIMGGFGTRTHDLQEHRGNIALKGYAYLKQACSFSVTFSANVALYTGVEVTGGFPGGPSDHHPFNSLIHNHGNNPSQQLDTFKTIYYSDNGPPKTLVSFQTSDFPNPATGARYQIRGIQVRGPATALFAWNWSSSGSISNSGLATVHMGGISWFGLQGVQQIGQMDTPARDIKEQL